MAPIQEPLLKLGATYGMSPVPGESENDFALRVGWVIDPPDLYEKRATIGPSTFLTEWVKRYAEMDAHWTDYVRGLPPEHPNCLATFEVVDHASQPLRSIADVLRSKFPGLSLTSGADASGACHYSGHMADFPGSAGTSTPQPIEETMTTQNPYDRRDPQPSLTARAFGRQTILGQPGFMEAPQALTIEDLNAMVLSARTRGAQTTADEMTMRHQEEVLTRQRQAWEEGRSAGVVEGRDALLTQIAEQYETKVRERIEALEPHVPLQPGDLPTATKAELADAIRRTVLLLEGLIEAHHEGFEPRPF